MSEDDQKNQDIIISKKYINHILNGTKKKVIMAASLIKDMAADSEMSEWENYNGRMALLAEYYAGAQSLIRILEDIIMNREIKNVNNQEGYPLELGDFSLVNAAMQGILYCQSELVSGHNITFDIN